MVKKCNICGNILLLNADNFYYSSVKNKYINTCKECYKQKYKKKSRNKYNRPQKSKKELEKIKKQLNDKDYMTNVINHMSETITNELI